jgi:uncharacterized protein
MTVFFKKKEIQFDSEGDVCAGYLYYPATLQSKAPCVVMANGFSGTMDWILPSFAEAFASQGYCVLIFDYRHLGQSAGRPRQMIDPRKQLTDLKNAIQFAKAEPHVSAERIVLWGTSLGGSHVVTLAAQRPEIAAVICNMPAIDAVKGSNVKGKMKKANASTWQLITSTAQLLGAALTDTFKGLLGLEPYYIKVFGKPGKAFFTDPSLAIRFELLEKESLSWKNEVAPRFLFHAPRYKEGTMERIKIPMFITLASEDVELSVPFIKEKAQKAALAEVKEYPYGHFDLYHGEPLHTVLTDQIDFLKRHVPPGLEQSHGSLNFPSG